MVVCGCYRCPHNPKVVGKDPPDLKFWVLGGIPPAFVKFEGPFFAQGPTWRIELFAPRWPK